MFQSGPEGFFSISHSLELNVCTLVGQEWKGMSAFCQQLWLQENFSFFFNVSHIENLSKKGIKRRSEKQFKRGKK